MSTGTTTPGRAWAAPLIIVAAVVLAYANSLHVPLHLDDTSAIANNPSIERLWPWWQPLAPPAHVTTGGRPLANLTFAFNYALGGTSVRGYHVANLVIHGLAALTLFGLVRRTAGSAIPRATTESAGHPDAPTAIGFSAALLWAVHPLATGTVTYLSQRTEALMALFYLLTLYAFVRSGESAAPRRWQGVSVLACAAGMACKEPMLTAPLVVLFFDRVFVGRSFAEAWRARRGYYVALAGTWLLLAALLTTGLAQRQVGFGLGVSPWRYFLTQGEALTMYLRLALWPWPLVFDYGPAMQPNLVAAAPFAGAIALGLAATAIALGRAPRAGFLLAAFFVVLAPTSSLVPVALQPIAENRAYLPLAALTTLAACAAYRALGVRGTAALLVAVPALMVATHARNEVFQSPQALWRDTIVHRPENPRAYDNYASALADAGRLADAIAVFERALQLNPASANTHAMLAGTWARAGRPDRAEQHFRRALELNPQLDDTRQTFGMFLYHAGRAADAAAELERVLARTRGNAATHHYLALASAQLGRRELAATHFRAALAARPKEPNILASYAGLLAATGHPAEALEQYRAALRLNPRLREAQLGAAAAAIALNRFAEAADHGESAIQLQPTAADAHYYTGVALFGLGRAIDAAAKFEQVLRLDPNHEAARAALAQIRPSGPRADALRQP